MLRKYSFFIANSIIIIFIIGIYFFVQFSELSFYKEMAVKQAQNDVRLMAVDINASISELTAQQLTVSQMMASDMFIRIWCRDETGETSGQHAFQLYSYLTEYRNKYEYDDVFFVSESTKNFYTDKGFNKTLDFDNPYDSWYPGFLTRMIQFDAQVDRNELNNDKVSLFVNCLVQDKGFKTLGIIGVSKNFDDFQKKVREYEDDYGVTICVVNVGGTYNSFDENYGCYMKAADAAEYMEITEKEVTRNVKVDESYTWFDGNKCYHIMYNPGMHWNIIVKKDMTDTIDSILQRTKQRMGMMGIFIICYAFVSFTLMARLSRVNRRAENVDELTGLDNSKIFKEIFERQRLRGFGKRQVSMFMLDIDDFKQFNDSYGHLYGNTIIKLVADGLKESIGKEGYVARWGGDEFIGIVYADEMETELLIHYVMDELIKMETHKTVTCSCGIVAVDRQLNLEKNMHLADEALYESKINGKARCTIYKK